MVDIIPAIVWSALPDGSNVYVNSRFVEYSGMSKRLFLVSDFVSTIRMSPTVSYTYDSFMRLATKTDANGQMFTYSYDSYNRLTQLSTGGNVLRTYVYDSNSDNPTYSQNAAGRLAEIRYPAINYTSSTTGLGGTTQLTDMFSYTQAGQVAGKLLQVTETNTFLQAGTYKNQTAVGGLNLVYAYNNEGKLVSVSYPTDLNNNTPTFTYTYDSMMRLSSMTDGSNYAQPVVNGAQYNAANQLTALNYYDTAETRSYNSLMQLTNITATSQYFPSTSINVSYNYPGGVNNGKISSMTDAISGETVSYQYDSLNRLISASGSGWTQTQAYDGFGNLTGRTGTGTASGTTISTPANQSTNQLSGYSYDANGNLLSTGYTYDPENRLIFTNAGAVQYGYDAKNKRIWQGICSTSCTPSWTLSAETITIFGANGKQLASYTPNPAFNNTTNQVGMTFSQQGARIYFGGKLVQYAASGLTPAVITDRLGSVGKYYPYGEERNAPQLPNDQVKFATYTRDSATGNDYADQLG